MAIVSDIRSRNTTLVIIILLIVLSSLCLGNPEKDYAEKKGVSPDIIQVILNYDDNKGLSSTEKSLIDELTYLFLNGNTDVKKAGKLILEGGTPDKNDYTYSVPSYNTELQALHWLAQDNEFDKNDTTAMAIAMDSGLISILLQGVTTSKMRKWLGLD